MTWTLEELARQMKKKDRVEQTGINVRSTMTTTKKEKGTSAISAKEERAEKAEKVQ